MADIALLTTLYSDMPTDALVHKLTYESNGLSPEALEILNAELSKRGVDAEKINNEFKAQQKLDNNLAALETGRSEAEMKNIWNTIFADIMNKKPLDITLSTLHKLGFEIEDAINLIGMAETKCKEILAKKRSGIYAGFIAIATSILLSILIYQYSKTSTIIFIGFIVWGVYKILDGLNTYPYKKILTLLAAD